MIISYTVLESEYQLMAEICPEGKSVCKNKLRITVWWFLVRRVLAGPWWLRRSPGAPAGWSWATAGSPVDSSPHALKDCPLDETLCCSPPSAPGQTTRPSDNDRQHHALHPSLSLRAIFSFSNLIYMQANSSHDYSYRLWHITELEILLLLNVRLKSSHQCWLPASLI